MTATDQGALVFTSTCTVCGCAVPYPGVGRPFCDDHRPAWFPPLEEVPKTVERVVTVREHLRRVKGDVTGPLARNTDPDTSHASAESVDARGAVREILEQFRLFGRLTADECADQLPHRQRHTIKSAISRLGKSGRLVNTGTTCPSACGRPSTVWARVQDMRRRQSSEVGKQGPTPARRVTVSAFDWKRRE